jgi:hypothetical protein
LVTNALAAVGLASYTVVVMKSPLSGAGAISAGYFSFWFAVAGVLNLVSIARSTRTRGRGSLEPDQNEP